MAAVKPKDIMNSIALLKQQNGSTVPEITKFLRQSNFFTRATSATKLAIHRALSRLCEQGLLTCKNSRYQANTLARTVVRRRRSRRRASASRRRRSARRRSRRRASASRRKRRSVRRRSRRRAITSKGGGARPVLSPGGGVPGQGGGALQSRQPSVLRPPP
ncbi:hypothetical protein PR048_005759 [Dryococelus australis]|uniref:H15 domain-containing protein n=1 Tax=Dryococelus australis TaxID=614101 RepID=A0ABQ9I978_9NEOP|nr:hypothetical protein PR048_005759 [Dryococelus australis]